jgi:hypothetical protein
VLIDLGGVEQADLVVVPQRANGHRSQPGEFADTEHEKSLNPDVA